MPAALAAENPPASCPGTLVMVSVTWVTGQDAGGFSAASAAGMTQNALQAKAHPRNLASQK
jgi:hypothetical protein